MRRVHTIMLFMAQTLEGAMKVAAGKTGLTVEDYQHRIENGYKWCVICKLWQPQSDFGKDSSRWDGLASGCRVSRNRKSKENYKPKPRPAKGRFFTPPRNGDAKQARRRINYFITAGLIPAPNSLPCTDCGHIWSQGGKRHEYDHYLGYAAENHERVEPVCTRCHHQREARRKMVARAT